MKSSSENHNVTRHKAENTESSQEENTVDSCWRNVRSVDVKRQDMSAKLRPRENFPFHRRKALSPRRIYPRTFRVYVIVSL